MTLAVACQPVVSVMLHPSSESEMSDELLHGMVVDLDGWQGDFAQVRTRYGYHGFVHRSGLVTDPRQLAGWQQCRRKVITHSFADVQAEPDVQSWTRAHLSRGSQIRVTGQSDHIWTEILLPTGSTGWVRTGFVGDPVGVPVPMDAARLREQVAATAHRYLGTQYRWGGRSALGIDCSGLTSISYYLNGVVIHRDAELDERVRQIDYADAQVGDLLFFPGHIAMYLGEDRFIHSSTSIDGVGVESLREGSPHFRSDLKESLYAVASVFDGERLISPVRGND